MFQEKFMNVVTSNGMKKQMFIMLSRGIVARNILRTDVFKILNQAPDLELIIFVPPGMPDDFRREFEKTGKVIFQETPDVEYTRFRKGFESILQKLVYTETAKFFMRYGGRWTKANKASWKANLGHIGASIIGRLPFLIPFFRWLEMTLFPDTLYDHFFAQYKPDLVFSTTIKSKRDIAILKSAKRFGVKSVSMARSWDNLCRILVAVKPDKLIVQNAKMMELAAEHHQIPNQDVFISGFPQFDLYHSPSTFMPHDEFIKSLGLDPNKKIIFFASEGVWAPFGHLAAKLIYEMAQNNEFDFPVNLIVRPHFSDLEENKYAPLFDGKPGVYLDHHFKTMEFFVDKWDPSFEEMQHLANELKHSDVLVTYATTLAIEAAINNTPIVNINFKPEGEPQNSGPFFGMYYQSSHYTDITQSHATRFAISRESLKQEINRYLHNPALEIAERKVITERLAYVQDGKAGERLANFLLSNL